ncbi:MAG: type II toxin-antitoxin system VapC family toxin [Comamonadaceae bacterium]|nr:MAG: type II toxin-antitoxin system VapC family toxin [Comamonadaceae bacterium]
MARRPCPSRQQSPRKDAPVVLVDTHIISELMRRTPDPKLMEWFGRTPSIAVSVVTVDEIVYGLSRRAMQQLRERFDEFLINTQILDLDYRIARRAGELRGALSAHGIVRHPSDMHIAATAQVHALTLVTRNVRNFENCGIPLLNPFSS